jgi:hypothetical protein
LVRCQNKRDERRGREKEMKSGEERRRKQRGERYTERTERVCVQ